MIVIADFGMGNIHSIQKALENYYPEVVFTDNPETISNAAALVIPGDGAFDQAMTNLEDHHLLKSFQEFRASGKPILGICIGFQILFESSEEGSKKGLGWFSGGVKRFTAEKDLKVPHMGWNNVLLKSNPHPYLKGVDNESFFYFIHSYYANRNISNWIMPPANSKDIEGLCHYGEFYFPAIMAKDNIFATQFHPEKSFKQGLKIIENFCEGLK